MVDALLHWLALRGLRLADLLSPVERRAAPLVPDLGIALARVPARAAEARALLASAVEDRARAEGRDSKGARRESEPRGEEKSKLPASYQPRIALTESPPRNPQTTPQLRSTPSSPWARSS